ncbi:MAG: acyltransferase [Breznakibacter sp.]
MRAYHIDCLRIFLTALVIFHHSAIAFGASGGWYYLSPVTTSGMSQLLLSAQMAIDQAYFMSLFFFISALLMPASFDRKGFRRFMAGRLVRLGIPLLVYTLLVHPALCFFIYRHTGHHDVGFGAFWTTIMTRYANPGPMWFVLTLLLFETTYALYRRFISFRVSSIFANRKPVAWTVVAFMVVAGLLAFAIRLAYPTGTSFFGLQFGFFSLYLLMYAAGIVAARKNWLDLIGTADAWRWFGLAMLAVPALLWMMGSHSDNLEPFAGGINLQALFYAMWEPVVCVGISYFLLVFAKKYAHRPNRWVLALSADSYAAYIIHPVIVVAVTMWTETIHIAPLWKLAVVLAIAIPASFGLAHLLRKVPGLGRII